MDHASDRPAFTFHTGLASFGPTLRRAENSRAWCRFVIHERGMEKAGKWHRVWAVYAFGDLALWACDCIRTGDRIIVVGHERGVNQWTDAAGKKHTINDISAWDLGQSMLRNPAYSERNEPTSAARWHRRVEAGLPAPMEDWRGAPEMDPPAYG